MENEGISIFGRVVFSTIVFVATNGGRVCMYKYIYIYYFIYSMIIYDIPSGYLT